MGCGRTPHLPSLRSPGVEPGRGCSLAVARLVQEVATRAVKQSPPARENGEEEEEDAEFGEEDLFHQQVVTLCPPAAWAESPGTHTCLLGSGATLTLPLVCGHTGRMGTVFLPTPLLLWGFCDISAAGWRVPEMGGVRLSRLRCQLLAEGWCWVTVRYL